MFKPSVAIIMPAHNAAKTIDQSIQSVVAQTYQNWRLYIIDDMSTDNTVEVAQNWLNSDDRIEIVILDQWSGVAAARNKGLEMASSDYVAFLDSDDYWADSKLQTQIDFLEKSGSAITFTSYYRVNIHGHIIGIVSPPKQVDYYRMLKSNYIGNSTSIFKRELFSSIKFKKVTNEDHLFWLNCLEKLKDPVFSCQSPEPLAFYRVNPLSLSGNKFKSLLGEWYIYKYELSFGYIKSFYYISHYIYNGLMKRKTRS